MQFLTFLLLLINALVIQGTMFFFVGFVLYGHTNLTTLPNTILGSLRSIYVHMAKQSTVMYHYFLI